MGRRRQRWSGKGYCLNERRQRAQLFHFGLLRRLRSGLRSLGRVSVEVYMWQRGGFLGLSLHLDLGLSMDQGGTLMPAEMSVIGQ